MKRLSMLLWLLLTCAACHHPGAVVGTTPNPSAGGTIAGLVSTEANTPVVGRRVTAIDLATGARYDARTGTNGGYTIQVPQGRYRLEIELLAGETLAKEPGETQVNRSDLDPDRNFVIKFGGRETS